MDPNNTNEEEVLELMKRTKASWQDGNWLRGLNPRVTFDSNDQVTGQVTRRSPEFDNPGRPDGGSSQSNNEPEALCPTSGTITVVLSGIASCGCMPGAHSSANITAFSGLNGAHTLMWDPGPGPTAGSFVLNGFGSCTLTQYDDEICSNVVGTIDGNFNIQAICGGGTWNVVVTIFAVGFTIFEAVAEPSGTPMNNTIVCPGTQGMGGGTATVS